MGVWGPALYSCDIADDLKTMCQDVFAVYDKDKATQLIFEEYEDIINQDYVDNEYASFWYALADWQWKHGLLSDDIRGKALELLEKYAGMEEWEDEGNKSNIRKRIAVLDKLKHQLQSEQPPLKLPKIHIFKPKHKAGDIVIFKTCTNENDEYNNLWKIENLKPPFMYLDKKISESEYDNIKGTDRHDCYMAVLCVGTVKEPYSEYISDIFNEHSIYVWYDYCSETLPEISDLQKCGFLPYILIDYEDYNTSKYASLEWCYKFTLILETFKNNDNSICTCFKKEVCLSETERFNTLFSIKNYSKDYGSPLDLISAYELLWEESERAKISGIPIDNLLDANKKNPDFKTPRETTEAHKKWVKEYLA